MILPCSSEKAKSQTQREFDSMVELRGYVVVLFVFAKCRCSHRCWLGPVLVIWCETPIIRRLKSSIPWLPNPRSPSTSSSTSSSNQRQNDTDEGAGGGSSSDRDLSPQEVEKLVQMQEVTGIDDLQVECTT